MDWMDWKWSASSVEVKWQRRRRCQLRCALLPLLVPLHPHRFRFSLLHFRWPLAALWRHHCPFSGLTFGLTFGLGSDLIQTRIGIESNLGFGLELDSKLDSKLDWDLDWDLDWIEKWEYGWNWGKKTSSQISFCLIQLS